MSGPVCVRVRQPAMVESVFAVGLAKQMCGRNFAVRMVQQQQRMYWVTNSLVVEAPAAGSMLLTVCVLPLLALLSAIYRRPLRPEAVQSP